MRRIQATLLAGLFAFIIAGCGGVNGPVDFGGYVKDMATGAVVKGYTMEVETSEDKAEVDVDDETGKFSFSLPVGADYIVYVKKDGYKEFKSSNQAERPSNEDHKVNRELKPMINVPLIPASMTSPKITARVLDKDTGRAVSTGHFRVVATGLSAAVRSTLYGEGTSATVGQRFWAPDVPVIAGRIQNGAFNIDANQLLPGYSYQVAISGVQGHRDQVTALTEISTMEANTARMLVIRLDRFNQYGRPELRGQSHVGENGTAPVQITGRTITLRFDRPIEMKLERALFGKGSEQLLTVETHNSRQVGDTDRTSETLKAETITNPDRTASSNVRVGHSGTDITITLAADSVLIDGDIDTKDSLAYIIKDLLWNNVMIRDAGNQYEMDWHSLKSFNIQPKVIIRPHR